MGSEFLPDDYEVPSGSDKYLNMKADGSYRVRILAPPIFGQVGWSPPAHGQKYGKPIRKRDFEPWAPGEAVMDERNTIRHFWIMPVWDYKAKRVKVFEITQATIQRELKKYAKDPDWGTPLNYDVEIIRYNAQGKVAYSVSPKPKSPVPAMAASAWVDLLDSGFDINRMYATPENKHGGDPFPGATTAKPAIVSNDDDPFADARGEVDDGVSDDDIPF